MNLRLNRLRNKLFLIILLKFIVFFLIMRLIFFPNFLNSRFDNDEDKGDFVIEELIKRK